MVTADLVTTTAKCWSNSLNELHFIVCQVLTPYSFKTQTEGESELEKPKRQKPLWENLLLWFNEENLDYGRLLDVLPF